MRLARAICAALLVATAVAQGEPSPVFVELGASKASCYEQEPIRVRITFGHDREFFASRGVPLFQRAFDLPFQLLAPWLRELEGTRGIALPAPGEAVSSSCVLNETPARAARLPDRIIDGRTFAVHAIEHELLPLRPGRLLLAAAELRYAFAERFETDFLGGRTPVDRQVATVRGNDLELRVLPLPAPRPPEFCGAVGQLAVRADAEPRLVTAGMPLRLSLHVTGPGNLQDLPPPPLPPLAGFHVRGVLAAHDSGSCTFTWELAPRSAAVTAIPAVPFCYFDPGEPPGYRTLRTAPIPITVRGGDPAAVPPDLGDAFGVPGETDIHGLRDLAARTRHPSLPWLLLALLLPWALAFGLQREVARRERDRRDPAAARARHAAHAFVLRIAATGDAAAAFPEYLAARLRCTEPAVIARDLAARIAAASVPVDLAARTHALVRALVAARYGGPVPVDAAANATALVGELERAFADAAAVRAARARQVHAVLWACLAFACAPRAQAPDPAATAALFYRQGDFAAAAEQFELALAAAPDEAQRGAVLANLGACAFRRGDAIAATWHWRRALRRLPGDPGLHWNLRFAEAQLGVAAMAETSLVAESTQWIISRPPAQLLLLCALLQAAGLLTFVLVRQRAVRIAAVGSVALGLLAAARYVEMQVAGTADTAVVLAGTAVRAAPDAGAATTAELTGGAIVSVQEPLGDWVRVEHDGGAGFVARAALGIVD